MQSSELTNKEEAKGKPPIDSASKKKEIPSETPLVSNYLDFQLIVNCQSNLPISPDPNQRMGSGTTSKSSTKDDKLRKRQKTPS